MKNATFEISDQIILIKLLGEDFDYYQIQSMLTRLASKSEAVQTGFFDEDDIISRGQSELGDRFDNLSDK